MVRSVAVDPVTPQRVYAAGPAGLVRSDDGGLTWRAAGEALAVALDPTEPQRVFALLRDDALWQSSDGATTWQKVDMLE